MDEPLMLDSRRIKSGLYKASDRSFAVIDGYLEIKPPGFGLQGWSASVTIDGSAGALVNTSDEGELEVEDDRGERWQGRCFAKISASSARLSELDLDGHGPIQRIR